MLKAPKAPRLLPAQTFFYPSFCAEAVGALDSARCGRGHLALARSPRTKAASVSFRPAMRNPPGRHLLCLSSRAVRSSSSSSALGPGPGAVTSAASPRPRAIAPGRPLRASSPSPPYAVAAAAYVEDGDWEEVVAGGPGTGEMEEEQDYRVVFWSPPTIDEVTGAVTSIQQ